MWRCAARREGAGGGGAAPSLIVSVGIVLLLGGCRRLDDAVMERFRDRTPHEEYVESLRDAGLDGTALVAEWTEAAGSALRTPVDVPLPYREEGYLAPEDPEAVGLRFEARDGQRISVELELAADTLGRLFVELFRERVDGAWPPVPLLSTDAGSDTLFEHQARHDAAYLLRIQPELLRGGRYRVTIRAGPSLAFPVEGRDTEAILSGFGAPRDGGRREHHGVDVFAPRGTPALAAAEGRVSRVRETPRGGRVVWIRDERGSRFLYYAHLDRQLVRQGQRVRPGDTVGLVGNTGNARGTRPHLHFGIYARGRGPTDPFWSLYDPRSEPAALEAPPGLVGGWARTAADGVRLRAGPSRDATVLGELPLHTALTVLSRTGPWYRVRLPDGSRGFLAADLASRGEEEIATRIASTGVELLRGPREGSVRVHAAPEGARLGVLGRFGDFLLVRIEGGRWGWMRAAGAAGAG